MSRGPLVLVVEDDPGISEMLATALDRRGYRCRVERDGPAGLKAAKDHRPELVILDLMLPGMDGLSVCRELRRESRVPILMLTARDGEADKVLGLELGADDYVTKPFSLAELDARIRSLLRRAAPDQGPGAAPVETLERHGLSLDLARRKVARQGVPVELTATEFELLAHLVRNPGRVFTREDLLQAVWGYSFEGYGRTVDSHVTRLRKKIETDPHHPRLVQTVRGVGYRFAEAS